MSDKNQNQTSSSTSANTLHRAGDVIVGSTIIQSLNGTVHDISPQVLSIEIVENIFEPFTSGTITVSDAIDALNLLPLVGNETVTVEFVTPTLDEQYKVNRQFYVYGCSDKIVSTNRSAIYQLRIISMEAITDRNVRISKTFRGNPSSIVASIIEDSSMLSSAKRLISEDCSNSITFISNWWHPTQCIEYVCRRALNSNKTPSYIFYETNFGFMFVSLESLVDSESVQTFTVDNYATQPTKSQDSTSTPNVVKDYQSILRVDYNNGFDYFERIDSGYFGGEVIAFDINTHQYVHSQSTLDDTKVKRLNRYGPIIENVFASTSGRIEYAPYVTQNFDGLNSGLADTDVQYRTQRQQILSQLATSKATIQVYGRTDYIAGMVVTLNIPKNAQITKTETETRDMLVSGKYIATSIKHIITGSRHICNIQLMKDSYLFDINASAYSQQSTENQTSTTDQQSQSPAS